MEGSIAIGPADRNKLLKILRAAVGLRSRGTSLVSVGGNWTRSGPRRACSVPSVSQSAFTAGPLSRSGCRCVIPFGVLNAN